MDGGMEYALAIGFGSFLVASLVVGLRLVLLSRRTGQLPELLIGVGVLGIGPLGFGLSMIAMGLALLKLQLIYTFVLFAWGALGAAFSPVVLLALYWRGLTRTGALACMIIGPAVVILWKVLELPVYELIPGVIAGTIAAVVGSLLTRRTELAAARPHPHEGEGV